MRRALLSLSLLGLSLAYAQEGSSTFGHARTRHLVSLGQLPQPGDVVVEDLINYHRHRLPLPKAGERVALDVRFGGTGFDASGRVIFQVGLTTPRLEDTRHLPPVNLALVIDVSGSMNGYGKMSRVQEALEQLLKGLRPTDRVAIVAYSNEARVALPSQPLGDGRAALEAVRGLIPGGSTNLHSGLMLGFDEALKGDLERGNNRVILLTDGIANEGVTDPKMIVKDAQARLSKGVDLSTIGVGTSLNRQLLETLAQGGRGLHHFVADDADIKTVFVRELQSLIAPVARGVSLQLEWGVGLKLDAVFGYAPEQGARSVKIPLDDMNYGLTQVVVGQLSRAEGEGFTLRAALSFTEVEGGQGRREVEARLSAEGPAELLTDEVVRKNYTIARLASGLHQAAVFGASQRFMEAKISLSAALEQAQAYFPSQQDLDVKRVYEMAKQALTVVEAHCIQARDEDGDALSLRARRRLVRLCEDIVIFSLKKFNRICSNLGEV